MPIKPIKTPKKPKTKNEFNNILLNKFLKIDKTAFANKNFSPKQSKVVNIFKHNQRTRKSSVAMQSHIKNVVSQFWRVADKGQKP